MYLLYTFHKQSTHFLYINLQINIQQTMTQTQQEQQNSYKLTKKYFINEASNVLPPLSISSTVELKSNNLKQCRICLQTEVSQSNPMVVPCMCIGTVKYVHHLCFRKWIERQVHQATKTQLEKLQKEGVQCELCKTKMRLVFDKKYKCCTFSKFVEKYSQNAYLFYLFIFFFLLDFGCIAFLIYNASHSTDQLVITILTIFSLALLTSIGLLGIYYLIKKYFIQIVNSLQGYKCQLQSKRIKISKREVPNQHIIE